MHKKELIQKINAAFEMKNELFFVISFDTSQCWAGSPSEAFTQGILFSFNNNQNFETKPQNKKNVDLEKSPFEYQHYVKSFDTVMANIKRGNSYLVNLTASTPVKLNASLKEIFYNTSAKYRLLYKNDFLVFSPETFVQVDGNNISAYPMKGTIDADIDDAESILLNNSKEMAEHATIVDLLRNDLSRHASNVQVKRFRYVEKVFSKRKTLLQVSSQISGLLSDQKLKQMGEVLFDMLPAGSISGAPKKQTLKIIEQAETHKRGFYTGIAGYYNGHVLDTCVLIRFIENCKNNYIYKSGGGITSLSKPEDEYNELIDKIYVPNR